MIVDTSKFTRKTEDHGNGSYFFGVAERKRVADELRVIAEAIEAGDVIVTDVRQVVRATQFDYFAGSLILRYTERVGEKLRALYGDSKLPLDVQTAA